MSYILYKVVKNTYMYKFTFRCRENICLTIYFTFTFIAKDFKETGYYYETKLLVFIINSTILN